MNKFPLISCLCLTENRVRHLKRAVNCFLHQTYLSKELVVVYRDTDVETAKYLSEVDDDRIRSFVVPKQNNVSLGELRNISIQNSNGEFFCQWDDDDWCHSSRLQLQMDLQTSMGKEASVLTHMIFFNTLTGCAYFSFSRPWEGTLICSKRLYFYGMKYGNLDKQEDTHFVSNLMQSNNLCPVSTAPIYIYIQHGLNTWNQGHFNYLYSLSQPLSNEDNKLIKYIVEEQNQEQASKAIFQSSFLKNLNYFHLRKT